MCWARPPIVPTARWSRRRKANPVPRNMAALEDLLAQAKRPMLLLGGSRWNETARAQIAYFAERFGLPVATSYRRGPLFDQTHPNHAGDLGLFAEIRNWWRASRPTVMVIAGYDARHRVAKGPDRRHGGMGRATGKPNVRQNARSASAQSHSSGCRPKPAWSRLASAGNLPAPPALNSPAWLTGNPLIDGRAQHIAARSPPWR